MGPTLGKRSGHPLNSVNNVGGQNVDCFLLLVTDAIRDEKFLVDGGALLSILPPTPQQKLKGPNDVKLKAANGSDIACYGSVERTIKIGTTVFNFEFIIADVQTRILGADFLAKNALAPNHRDAHLINLLDFSTLPAEHARGFKSVPINFVNQIDDPYLTNIRRSPLPHSPSDNHSTTSNTTSQPKDLQSSPGPVDLTLRSWLSPRPSWRSSSS